TDSTLFIKQIEMLIRTNNQYKIISLFEEILFTKDEELKNYIKNRRIHELSWIYNRLVDVCGAKNKTYLLDCSIMLMGMIHSSIFVHSLIYQDHANIHQIVQYCVNRVLDMVNHLSKNNEVLIKPDTLYNWIALQSMNDDDVGKKEILCMLYAIKADLKKDKELLSSQEKIEQLLTFIEEEVEIKYPRYFLMESTLISLMQEVKETPYAKTVQKLSDSIKKVYSKRNQ
ncbi:hypothetical protein, partial [Niallia circulans]|uniref:hypothetical protein n=1 Tax=Niallia circulans TaxID=1397 RepID=UPI001560491E